MRSLAVAALAFALAACGGGDGGELVAGDSRLSEAQVDAALGPEDQSAVQDALVGDSMENGLQPAGNAADPADNAAVGENEVGQ